MSYEYASGRVRALETRLLNSTDIERMVDAPDAATAFRVFNDTDYADNLLDVTPEAFVQALNDDAQQTRDELVQMVDDERVLRFLFLKNDYLNLKIAFKSAAANEDLSAFTSYVASTSIKELMGYVADNGDAPADDRMKRRIDTARESMGETPDAQQITVTLDRQYFAELRTLADDLGTTLIRDLATLQIDMANVKIFLRSRKLGRNRETVQDEFAPGGSVAPSTYQDLYDEDTSTAVRQLAAAFPVAWDMVFDRYLTDERMSNLEKDLEELELEHLRQAKRMGYGLEVLIAYAYAKRNAARNVRIIMTGKLNGLSSQEIRERVRSTW